MIVDELFAVARMSELALAERAINQRAEWRALQRVDRLEEALRVARTQLRFTFAPEAR